MSLAVVPVVPVVHTGGASQVLADALVSILGEIFADELTLQPLAGEDAVLHAYAASPFTIFSLNRLNLTDDWLSAAAGAAYCSMPGDTLGKICPVMLAGQLSDDLFSRFQGISLNEGADEARLYDDLVHLVDSLRAVTGANGPVADWAPHVVALRAAVLAGRRALAAAFAIEPAGLVGGDRTRASLAERSTGARPDDDPHTVFVSWSKSLAESVGRVLRDALESVTAGRTDYQIFYSPTNIGRGDLWLENFAEGLRETDAAVICISEVNQHSKWLCFEFGALVNSARRPRVVVLRSDDALPEGLFSLVGSIYRSRATWDRVDASGKIEFRDLDAQRELTELFGVLGVDVNDLPDGNRVQARLHEAHSGGILTSISIDSRLIVDYPIDFVEPSNNITHWAVECVGAERIESFVYAPFTAGQIDILLAKVAASEDEDFHRRDGWGWSPSLHMVSQLAQHPALSADGARAILALACGALPQQGDELEQILGFLTQSEVCSADVAERIDVITSARLFDSTRTDLASCSIEVLKTLRPPVPEASLPVETLVADIMDTSFARVDALISSAYRVDSRASLGRVHETLWARQQGDRSERTTTGIKEYVARAAGRVPTHLHFLFLAYMHGSDLEFRTTYANASSGHRALFALNVADSDPLRDPCATDAEPWVRTNVARNPETDLETLRGLQIDHDPDVRNTALARSFEGPEEWADLATSDLPNLAAHGARLVHAESGLTVTAMADLLPTLPGVWSEYALLTPFGTHVQQRLGWSVPETLAFADSAAVLEHVTLTYLLNYLDNGEALAERWRANAASRHKPEPGPLLPVELAVPFPLFRPERPGVRDELNDRARRAQLVRLGSYGYFITGAVG